MRPRLVRVGLDGVSASLDHHRVSVIDISRRGVLVRVPESKALGSRSRVMIWKDQVQVTFSGRVVRVEEDGEVPGEWQVALEFLSLSPAQVGTLLRPLFALLSRKPKSEDDQAAAS